MNARIAASHQSKGDRSEKKKEDYKSVKKKKKEAGREDTEGECAPCRSAGVGGGCIPTYDNRFSTRVRHSACVAGILSEHLGKKKQAFVWPSVFFVLK